MSDRTRDVFRCKDAFCVLLHVLHARVSDEFVFNLTLVLDCFLGSRDQVKRVSFCKLIASDKLTLVSYFNQQ
jgi:hypothetical protein